MHIFTAGGPSSLEGQVGNFISRRQRQDRGSPPTEKYCTENYPQIFL